MNPVVLKLVSKDWKPDRLQPNASIAKPSTKLKKATVRLMSSHLAYLVLGSNLGNRSTNLANAKTEISALSETKILKESEIYKSPAYGPIDQPFF